MTAYPDKAETIKSEIRIALSKLLSCRRKKKGADAVEYYSRIVSLLLELEQELASRQRK
jgi:hypothetical protein